MAEFSFRSRRRLLERARDLSEMHAATAMLTLTVPGEWRSAIPDGRSFKRALKRYVGRLRRYMTRQGVSEWSALWFLEFQRRGAPHVHAIFWGSDLEVLEWSAFRQWSSVAWAECVGHRDPEHRRRHQAAGSRVERMRSGHFGYACAYASKMRQKAVPHDFLSVGRFWGFWNFTPPKPVVWHFADLSHFEVAHVVRALAGVSYGSFGSKLLERFARASQHSDTFAATVLGVPAVHAALDLDRPQVERVALSGGAPPKRRSVLAGRAVDGAP